MYSNNDICGLSDGKQYAYCSEVTVQVLLLTRIKTWAPRTISEPHSEIEKVL